MNARRRFAIAVVILGLLMTGPFLLTVAILQAELKHGEEAVLAQVLLPRLPLGVLVTAAGFVIGIAVLRNLFRQYVVGLLRMAEHLRLMHGANRSFRVAPAGPPEVRQLAEAANELAAQRDALLTDVEDKIRAAQASVEEERNRLAALVAELPQPVIVCNLDGRILLYNNRARLQATALGRSEGEGEALIGLGRSIYAAFDRSLVGHALETLQRGLDREGSQPLAHFVTASRGGQLIRVQVAPVPGGEREEGGRRLAGYVLTLENISTSAQTLWPLEEMRAGDLMTAIERRIVKDTAMAVKVDQVDEDLWVKVDSYSLVLAMAFLAGRLASDYGARLVRLRMAAAEGDLVHVDLLWTGTAVSTEILIGWQLEPLDGVAGSLILRDVTDRHGGQFTCGRDTASQQ
ncbi:MAG TPA: DNA polymerase III subunit epsilon, partial [Rhodocyclaceae bacterium]|nr:DNA polymerase III subunit epsilon [Rhodocyclaceae bacterium]